MLAQAIDLAKRDLSKAACDAMLAWDAGFFERLAKAMRETGTDTFQPDRVRLAMIHDAEHGPVNIPALYRRLRREELPPDSRPQGVRNPLASHPRRRDEIPTAPQAGGRKPIQKNRH